MKEKTIQIKTLTPVWTGDSEGLPHGLRLSGVLGSMRYIFEAAIRWAGGHTCDITSKNAANRCNYEKDKNICPACAIFGCTGFARAFKIDWDLPKTQYPVRIPFNDGIEEYSNRKHDGDIYKGGAVVESWIVAQINQDKRFDGKNSQSIIANNLKPGYSRDWTTLKIVQLHPLPDCFKDIDVVQLIADLLCVMADRYAIGAKVNQGWGFFETDVKEDIENVENRFLENLKKMIRDSQFQNRGLDAGLANLDHIFSYAEIPLKIYRWNCIGKRYQDTLMFNWDNEPSANGHMDFIALGYALQYRLRRIVKFAEFYDFEDYQENYFDDALKEVIAYRKSWAISHQKEIKNYYQNFNLPWKEGGAFAEYLFGKANGDDKHAGYVGVSHLYKRDRIWYVKLISQIPDEPEFVDTIYYLFKDTIQQGEINKL